MASTAVLLAYQQRLEQLQIALGEMATKQSATLAVLCVALLAGAALSIAAVSRRAVPLWFPALSLPVVLVSARTYRRRRLERIDLTRLRDLYNRGVDRLEDRWMGAGVAGDEFAVERHPYAADLNLFGAGSLFERLCTARTHLGRHALARYLQEPASLAEGQERQAAVRELAANAVLREEIALLGRNDLQESQWQTFTEWLGSAPVGLPMWLRPVLMASSALLAGLAIALVVVPSWWPVLQQAIIPLVALHAAIGYSLQGQVRRVIRAAAPVVSEFALIREGLALMAGQAHQAPKLTGLSEVAAPAARTIRQLEPWFAILRERMKDWYYLPALGLLLGTQSAVAIEAWRMRHREELTVWLNAWAEYEALNALGGYAHENPEDCWPEMGTAGFAADDLGHPLLPPAVCVRNDIALGDCRFYVVSGSNMAGKSTLLRSVGLAAVLAYAGAPVRARSLRLAVMRVCASISVVDSLREGKSRFLAEMERLRDTLDTAAHDPTLFLIDEIFSGTNSPDRKAAADAVVRTLAERGAIGAFSTHDIALSEIAVHGGANVHMASREGGEGPLDFDYRLKPGVTRESNALAIARLAGVPV